MYLTVNHTTLYYTQHGHGHPLILLHGNGTSHAIFADLIPQLAPNFTVYALDARDHGQSSTTDYISYQLMATDVRDFIQTLNLRAPTVIGVGDGGISALLVASAHPTIIGRLILAGVHTQPRDLRLRKRIALAADYFSRPRKKLGLQMWGHITNEQLARVSAPTSSWRAPKVTSTSGQHGTSPQAFRMPTYAWLRMPTICPTLRTLTVSTV
ncbi:alpha/beta fold hydrolase [Lacticaseibacillus thailandensis]|uniref:alpha/beta fold hydrolase n=1 Tax=Lacticaseibacillus thailandensis TaxID=381741 RepID=UPI0006CF7AA2|nr:alpha/beta hydrolase [Lacticaseibacillus thailandensis]